MESYKSSYMRTRCFVPAFAFSLPLNAMIARLRRTRFGLSIVLYMDDAYLRGDLQPLALRCSSPFSPVFVTSASPPAAGSSHAGGTVASRRVLAPASPLGSVADGRVSPSGHPLGSRPVCSVAPQGLPHGSSAGGVAARSRSPGWTPRACSSFTAELVSRAHVVLLGNPLGSLTNHSAAPPGLPHGSPAGVSAT